MKRSVGASPPPEDKEVLELLGLLLNGKVNQRRLVWTIWIWAVVHDDIRSIDLSFFQWFKFSFWASAYKTGGELEIFPALFPFNFSEICPHQIYNRWRLAHGLCDINHLPYWN